MLSAVVLTKNEEKNIKKCLDSLKFCDEIIVIDDKSQDKTVELAKACGATICQRKLDGDFAKQRNFGLEKAKGEWVLFVDADEEVTEELRKEIQLVIIARIPTLRRETKQSRYVSSNFTGIATSRQSETRNDVKVTYYLKRRDFFFGRELKHGEIKKVKNKGLIRLVKKNSGHWTGLVHEEYQVQRGIGQGESLTNYLNHYPHQTIKEFLHDVNYYSSLRARELFKKGKKTNLFEIVFYPFGKFFLNYFLKRGFLDGPQGFVYAFFMSFHSFLVRAKLYQYWEIDH